tara:strand:+ start:48 stop:563 length:516 start_codon:yes stop_codon:yes gene_type:complete
MLRQCFTGILLALAIAAMSSAQPPHEYAEPTESELLSLFSNAGYEFETTANGFRWMIHPNGTRVSFLPYGHSDQQGVSAIRLGAMFLVWESSAAREAADYYESTNPLASVATLETEEGIVLVLQRDIMYLRHRTPENILANTSILFQLIPVFQSSIADSDPELAQRWGFER